MDRAALDALVVGYENLISKLTLPDENDRHVLAAAIRGKAQVIVTMNLKDFPAEVLQKYDMEAQHPDEFILRLIDLAPYAVKEAAETHRQSLKNPPKSIKEFLASLEAQGLPQSVPLPQSFPHGHPARQIVSFSRPVPFRFMALRCWFSPTHSVTHGSALEPVTPY
jgi:hypothetical protein